MALPELASHHDQPRGLASRSRSASVWIYLIFALEAALLALGLFPSATVEIAVMDVITLAILLRAAVARKSFWSNAAAISQSVALLSLLVAGPKGLIVMGAWFSAHLTTLAALTILFMDGPVPVSGRHTDRCGGREKSPRRRGGS